MALPPSGVPVDYTLPAAERRAAERARWEAMTPAERAAGQQYADDRYAESQAKLGRSRRFGNLAKWGIIGTAAGGAGYGALAPLLAGAPAAIPAATPLTGALPTAATAAPTIGTVAGAAGPTATGIGTAASPFVLGTTAAVPGASSALLPTALGLGTAAAPFVLGNEPPYTDADWQGPLPENAGSPTGTGLGDVPTGPPYTDADWQGPLQENAGSSGRNWREWADRAGDLGDILGNAAGGSALERNANNASINQRNAALANIFGTQQNAASRALEARADEQARLADVNLRQRQFALDAPTQRGKQSVRGSLMANLQPATFSGLPEGIARTMPTITGGLTPATFSPETRELGRELSRAALVNQLKGDTFDPLTPTDFQSGLLPKPELEAMQRSSTLDKVISGAGLGTSLLGALGTIGNIYARQRRP